MSERLSFLDSLKPESNTDGMKKVLVVCSVLVYVLFVAWIEYHFYVLVTEFLTGSAQAVGLIAVGVSSLTAFILPAGIHYWFRSGTQLIVAFMFYAFHFLMAAANMILSANAVDATEGGTLAAFISGAYASFILPAYLVAYGAFWSILWFVDPSSRRLDARRQAEEMAVDAQLHRRLIVENQFSLALQKAFASKAAQRAMNKHVASAAPELMAQELGLSLEDLGLEPGAVFEFEDESEPWTLQRWLDYYGMTLPQAQKGIADGGWKSAKSAWHGLGQLNFIPQGMTPREFAVIWRALQPVQNGKPVETPFAA